MNAKTLFRMTMVVSLLTAVFAAAPVFANNPIPNLYTSASIASPVGAPVKGGLLATDILHTIQNYGGSSQVGVIGTDIYIAYDSSIVRFASIAPKTGFFDNPNNYSDADCPTGYTAPTTTTKCVHLALTQQPGAGPVYNRTGVVATLTWVGVENGTTTLDILDAYSNLIQYPDNNKFSFTAVSDATIHIGEPGGGGPGAGAIQGQAIRYGYLGAQPITIAASMGGGPAVITNTLTDGTFVLTVPTGGNYSVKASYPGYLTAKKDNVYVSGAMINIGATRLWGGDVNLDNCVNIFDLVVMAAWLGASNDLVDINDDGIVNIYDLTLAVGSFNKCGPTPW